MAFEDPRRIEGRFLQGAIPGGMIDVDLADVDAMVACVADQLGRLVKPIGCEFRIATQNTSG